MRIEHYRNSGTKALAVTPSDTLDAAHNIGVYTPGNGLRDGSSRMLYLVATVAGAINVVTYDNDTVAIGAAVGVPIPISVPFVKATGTTATGIVAIYD